MKKLSLVSTLLVCFVAPIYSASHTNCTNCESPNLSIYIDDVPIREFSFSQKNYKRILPIGTKKVPNVSAIYKTCGKTENLNVIQASSPTGTATITLPNEKKYTIAFDVASKPVLNLKYPDITDVKIDDVFWNKYLDTFFKTTLPYSFKKFEEQGSIRHFQSIINGKPKAENNPWLDGLFFETITSAGNFLLVKKNDDLEKLIDSYIDVVFNASMTSSTGFLSSHVMAKNPNQFFDANKNALFLHDSYNFGCMIEAGLSYYKATKKAKLLYVACRFAEFIVANYGYGYKADGTPKINMVPSHSLPEETLLCLYQYLKSNPDVVKILNKFDSRYPLDIKVERYAELVKFWIENRGNYDRREHKTNYGVYAQDHKFYFDQNKGEGHAVRANLYYTGMVAAGLEFGNQTYISTGDKIWYNIYNKQMYVNGSVGAIGATEAYGKDYILPNDGYCETCASVAYGFFSHYLTSAHGESDYADAMELEMYNSILGCTNIEGNKFFYKNPLNIKNHNRWDWHVCACCPPMLLKFYSQIQKYIYSYNDNLVYVNQFIASKAKLGNGVEITQKANMPWNANVQFRTSKDITLKIRIPPWAKNQKPKIIKNNKIYDYLIENGYAVVDAKSTDTITFEMTISPRRIYAENVPFNKGKVAFGYGPIIYTIETTDNPTFADSAKDFSGTVQKNYKLNSVFEKDLFGGIYTLTATALDKSGKQHTIKAIPYYLRGNRGASGQYVWVNEK